MNQKAHAGCRLSNSVWRPSNGGGGRRRSDGGGGGDGFGRDPSGNVTAWQRDTKREAPSRTRVAALAISADVILAYFSTLDRPAQF